ncbi:MAG TPA: apolipoprotein N-acyltransferase, partial [Thermoanaerobaculia bacterium]
AFWGAYGVGFLVAAVAALLAAAVVRRRMRPALAAALVVLAVGTGGAIRLAAPPERPAKTITFALLQPGIPQESRLLEDRRASNYARVLDQARAAAATRPDLIVIPESALPVYWETSASLRRDLTELARSCDCAILFNDVDIEANDRYYNAARLLSPRGMGAPYRKVHLVPFGEYVPLPRIFFFVRQVSTEIGQFTAAEEPSVLRDDGLAVGVGVCYEILYPVLSWKQVRGGANLLVTISNDSWYGAGGAQAQHFAGAVLRAVENERYLLRAAITGISGVADERGRILEELGPDRPGTIHGTARLFDTRTAWTRYGFAFSGLCDAIAIAMLVFGFVRWRRERRARNPK